MSVSTGDITLLQSTNAGSTGGTISGSTITSGVKNNVLPDETSSDLAAGGAVYRKVFWKNGNSTDAMIKPVVFCPALAVNATFQIGIGYDSASDADASADGNMTAFGAPARVAVVSDGADTRQVTILGLDNSGTPVPISETVTLNGTSEVLTAATFSRVWHARAASTSARTVTVKQGTGGTTRGTILPSKLLCFLWVTAGTAIGNGIGLPDLPAGQNIGVWEKLAWIAGAGTVKPNIPALQIQEA